MGRTLSDFELVAELHRGASTLVYRALDRTGNQRVVVKTTASAYPTSSEVATLRREHDVLASLAIEGVIACDGIVVDDGRCALVLEDIGGESIADAIAREPLSVAELYRLAIAVADALGHLHASGVTHTQISAGNVVLDRQGGRVRLIDFDAASSLARENAHPAVAGLTTDDLAYMSPEQTGRMNRAVDYRTDFYSLGVTLYKAATGRLPFDSTDPIEIVHAHIARAAVPVDALRADIPSSFAAIVEKLMSKNAENRYQSAFGLKSDLERSHEHWRAGRRDVSFALGESDFSGRLRLSQRLYGRDDDVATISATFDQVCAGSCALVILTGEPGIGKTALAQEIFAPVAASRGYFASGKFDQLHRSVPYAPVMGAFGSLVRQILTSSSSQIDEWRDATVAALGAGAGALVELVPELELLIGPQPPVAPLPPVESQNRLYRLCEQLVGVFARTEHPLVLFFDDLQWADQGSLGLIERFMVARTSSSLLIIGAYRSTEIYDGHPALLMLEAVRRSGIAPSTITLAPLSGHDVADLIADSLDCPRETTRELAELVMSKTGGNPFFVNEFLKSIVGEGLVRPDFARGAWQWSIDELVARDMTHNVVELMVSKIEHLPSATKNLLELASCIGARFDLDMLSLVAGSSTRSTAVALRDASAAEVILPIGGEYRLAEAADEAGEGVSDVSYRFAHDRIRQAAYSLIDESERSMLHWRIGRLMLERMSDEQIDRHLFAIVNQLNIGASVGRDPALSLRLASLDLRAGIRAKGSAAYRSALEYLEHGIAQLTSDAWDDEYELTVGLYTNAIQAANLAGETDRMEQLAAVVLSNARSLLEKVVVYEERLLAYHNQHRMADAIAVGIEVLGLLGVALPSAPTQADVYAGMTATLTAIGDRDPMDLLDLPVMTDPQKLAAIRILLNLFSPAYVGMPDLYPLIVFRIIDLSLDAGNTPVSARGYTGLGMILCGVVGDIDRGYGFGRLAMELVERFASEEIRASAGFMFNAFIRHWKEPHAVTVEPLLEVYRTGLETGDLQFAALAAFDHCFQAFWSGMPLDELESRMRQMSAAIRQIQQEHARHLNEMYRQAVLGFIERADDHAMLAGDAYDESTMLPSLEAANDYNGLAQLFLLKGVLAFTFGSAIDARGYLDRAQPYLMGTMGTPCIPMWHFYDALVASVLAINDSSQSDEHMSRARASLERVAMWAGFAPANYRNKQLLIEAVIAVVDDRSADARELFDASIESSRAAGFMQEEALANELAGRYYLRGDRPRIARHYLLDARHAWQTWGADAKVAELDSELANLIGVNVASTRSTQAGIGNLDFASVLKASHAIAGEIVLERLLETLMRILMENAGASRGALMLDERGRLFLEAEGSIDGDSVALASRRPIGDAGDETAVPAGIVNYVVRTRESVVVADAASDSRYSSEPYVQERKPRALLCMPMINQGTLVGVLYLENATTVGAFTDERIEVLNVLAAEAAIAIENARLYGNIVALNAAYERFVPRQFLAHLEKESILDVRLGDQVQREMTVMFADIREFTSRSERMSPAENFAFVNRYLGRMEPAITSHDGFVDKYVGDGIMALFPTGADAAVAGGIAMLRALRALNAELRDESQEPIEIGIGCNSGRLMLGTVGGESRMDGTVISDAVNLASRIESLTKTYGVPMLLSEHTWLGLRDRDAFATREIDRVRVAGKDEPIRLFEVFDWDDEAQVAMKRESAPAFTEGLDRYRRREFDAAYRIFHQIASLNAADLPARIYMLRCEETAAIQLPVEWDGTRSLTEK